jgi:uncharacterized protein (DUF2141 family)
MQNEIYDEKNGLTYMLCGDYYLPELALKDIEPTFYAVKVFLDTNNNKQLDKSFLGVRKEPYGFSKNLDPILREPTFEEAKVEMTEENNTILIKLNNNKGEE